MSNTTRIKFLPRYFTWENQYPKGLEHLPKFLKNNIIRQGQKDITLVLDSQNNKTTQNIIKSREKMTSINDPKHYKCLFTYLRLLVKAPWMRVLSDPKSKQSFKEILESLHLKFRRKWFFIQNQCAKMFTKKGLTFAGL